MAATAVGADMIRRPATSEHSAPGCKADLSVVDMTNPYMQPDYEPIEPYLLANDRAIKDVYVDGRQVVRDGEMVDFDIADDIEMLRRAQAEAIAAAPHRDWAGRGLEQSKLVLLMGD